MSSNNKRILYLDIAKGIAIILMLIFHFMPDHFLKQYAYSFHMPLFIIISGYFYKDEKLTTFIKKTIKTLLIPYFICIIITYIIESLLITNNFDLIYLIKYALLGNSNAKISEIPSVSVLWFIPFLAAIRIIFYTLKKLLNKNKIVLFISIILISLLGLLLSKNKIYLPWSLDASLTCTLFYYVGYLINKYKILNYLFNNQHLFLTILFFYSITFLFGNIEISTRTYPFGIICLITAILGSLFVIFISKKIEEKIKPLTTVLTWYGKNSIYMLLFHYMESTLMNYNLTVNIILISILRLILITLLTLIYTLTKKELSKQN